MEKVGIGLVLKFCEETGINWRWLMFGEDPRILRYQPSAQVSSLSNKLAVMEATHPEQLTMFAKMIDAVAQDPPDEA